MGFANKLGSNQGQREHLKNQYARMYGELKDDSNQSITQSGIKIIAPRLYGGSSEHATGDRAVINGQSVQLFDGAARIIDSSVWEQESRAVEAYEDQILEMAGTFIRAGDALARKYLGNFYNYLKPLNDQGLRDNFVNMAQSADIDSDFLTDELLRADSRPSALRAMSELSSVYPMSIMKLKLVIRFAGFIFEGRSLQELPKGEAPDSRVVQDSAAPSTSGQRAVNTVTTKDVLKDI